MDLRSTIIKTETLARHDKIAMLLRNGTSELDENEFVPFEQDALGNVQEIKCRGAWSLTNNGCLSWSCAIPPFKTTASHAKLQFSQCLESLWKDVKCTFGTMKGRFRVLTSGTTPHGTQICDRIWLTCCVLHNPLLSMDDNENDWTGELGQFTEEETGTVVPFSLLRLNNPGHLRSHGIVGMGFGDDRTKGEEEDVENKVNSRSEEQQIGDCTDKEGTCHICRLLRDLFHVKLVEHFDICFSRKLIQWPERK